MVFLQCAQLDSLLLVYINWKFRSKDFSSVWVKHLWHIYFIDGTVHVRLQAITKQPTIYISKFDDWVKAMTVRLLQSKDTFCLYLGEKLCHRESILFLTTFHSII